MTIDVDLFGPSEVGSDEGEALAHYGVKGMRWGHRKPEDGSGSGSSSSKSGDDSSTSGGNSSSSSSQKQGLSDGQKKALKYAAGGALVAGALITTAVLAKNGKIPISSLQTSAFNKNSLAAETKRLSNIPGTSSYKSKMAKIPGSLQSETARMAKIPGTLANREARLKDAQKYARTLKPENQAEFMRRVTARIDEDVQRRATVQANRARLIAERAQREARESAMASRRQIVRNQAKALSDAKNQKNDSNDSPSVMDRVNTVKDVLDTFNAGKDFLDTVRSAEMWNRPVSELREGSADVQNGSGSEERRV